MGNEPEIPDLPPSLKRDVNNKAEFMKMSDSVSDVSPEAPVAPKTTKINGHAKPPVKAAGKPKAVKAAKGAPKAKTAPKAPVKAAKGAKKAVAAPKQRKPVETDQFGLRKGTDRSKAAAMYARKNGATLEEVKNSIGSVQLNVLTNLEVAGFKVERSTEARKGLRAVTRYRLIV
jgi:hypothetical protein